MPPVDEIKAACEEPRTFTLSFKNVLLATDFSPTSDSAVPYATAICRRFGGTLHTAHVLSDTSVIMMTGGVDYVSMATLYDDAIAEAKEKLGETAQAYEGIRHFEYVRQGQVWKSLAAIVEESHIDLIILGTHGRTGFGKLLLGSVAEDILRHAPCPVLTIGPNVSGRNRLPAFRTKERDLAPRELEVKQIVFGTNFAQNAALVAETAISLADEFRSRLTMVHVMEDYTQLGTHPGPIEDSIRRLRELIPLDASLHYLAETMVEFGAPHERILKVASDRDADLIVIGTRPERGTTHLPWTTTHQVIARASCPVLTVRT
jgi:nucleotide-binding universal stress UspA family protein